MPVKRLALAWHNVSGSSLPRAAWAAPLIGSDIARLYSAMCMACQKQCDRSPWVPFARPLRKLPNALSALLGSDRDEDVLCVEGQRLLEQSHPVYVSGFPVTK